MKATVYTKAELEFIKENAPRMFDREILAALNRIRDAAGQKPLTKRQIAYIRMEVLGIVKPKGTRYKNTLKNNGGLMVERRSHRIRTDQKNTKLHWARDAESGSGDV